VFMLLLCLFCVLYCVYAVAMFIMYTVLCLCYCYVYSVYCIVFMLLLCLLCVLYCVYVIAMFILYTVLCLCYCYVYSVYCIVFMLLLCLNNPLLKLFPQTNQVKPSVKNICPEVRFSELNESENIFVIHAMLQIYSSMYKKINTLNFAETLPQFQYFVQAIKNQ